jgi:hypothetical protein
MFQRTHVLAAACSAAATLLICGALSTAQAGPKVPNAPLDTRALRCWDLGTTFGSAFMMLDGRLRARGKILEAYCGGQKDPTLKRVPTEDDVTAIQRELTRAVSGPGGDAQGGAKVKTGPLDNQIRDGATSEENMLNDLLK